MKKRQKSNPAPGGEGLSEDIRRDEGMEGTGKSSGGHK